MKSKYISFFKKELVFLLVLLIVVCISFGITYANFIYNSDNKRAVEMFAGALSYNLKINGTYQNNINIERGSHIIDLEIESTNEISTYYKLLTNKNITLYSISGSTVGAIGSNEIVNIKLYVVNNTDEVMNVSFIVSMGYLTNTLDDVTVNNGYYEIDKMKDEITYDNKKWKVLRVNEDTSIDLIGEDLYSVTLKGYEGYNDLIDLFNSKCINSRSINIDDIEGLVINSDNDYTEINRLVYFPISFKSEDGVLINDNLTELNGYGYSNGVLVKNKNIISNISNNLFKDKKYLIATPYYEVNSGEINFYTIEINNGSIIPRKLFNSNNTNYEITSNVRCITNIKDIAF